MHRQSATEVYLGGDADWQDGMELENEAVREVEHEPPAQGPGDFQYIGLEKGHWFIQEQRSDHATPRGEKKPGLHATHTEHSLSYT